MADETNVKALNELLQGKRDKLAELQSQGMDPFKIVKADVSHHSREIKENFAELEGKEVTAAGRMMSKRVMGKASFCGLQDRDGSIQIYVTRDNLGEDIYNTLFKPFSPHIGFTIFKVYKNVCLFLSANVFCQWNLNEFTLRHIVYCHLDATKQNMMSLA